MDKKGKSFLAENRQMAFDVYCELGGNVEGARRELKRRGLSLSRATFDEWKDKGDFKGRMLKLDAERQKAADDRRTLEQRMVQKLVVQIDKYEAYLEGLAPGTMDNQAVYAYTNLLKTIIGLSRKGEMRQVSPADIQEEAEKILEAEYGIKR